MNKNIVKNYEKEIKNLKKMLKYYGKIVLIRECDKGIVLITENQKTITFVEHDGEMYYLVCEIVNLISHDGLTFEDAFNKFEKQNKSQFELDENSLSYIKEILNNNDYSIKFTHDMVFPVLIQYTDEENNIHQTYLNQNSKKFKALKFEINKMKDGKKQ